MWYQVFLGEGDDAMPTSRPLKELDLLREIASLVKQGVTWEEMDVRAIEKPTREPWEIEIRRLVEERKHETD